MSKALPKRASVVETAAGSYAYYPISQVEGAEDAPLALKVLIENVLRKVADDGEATLLARRIVDAAHAGETGSEVEFSPARVLFQDFTGVPVFVDFAVMREACAKLGGRPVGDQPARALRPCDRPLRHRGRGGMRRCARGEHAHRAGAQS